MGRYYSGDIEGKFWFGIQSSTDASFFGGEEREATEVGYYFETDDLPDIRKGVDECIEKLGGMHTKLDQYFEKHDSYNDAGLAEHLAVEETKLPFLLEWYARLVLGRKILAQVEKEGTCEFTADL